MSIDDALVRAAGRLAFGTYDDRVTCEIRKAGIEPTDATPEEEQLATCRVLASIHGVPVSVAAEALAEAKLWIQARGRTTALHELFAEVTHGR